MKLFGNSRKLQHGFAALLITLGCLESKSAEPTPERNEMRNAQDFARAMTELSNWGRWGKEDQLGALESGHAAKAQRGSGFGEGWCFNFSCP